MGMTKAIMEKTAQAFARDFQDSDTTISITRYGNVMYSRGSVIPLFISQIRSGGPVTVTDLEMTRFLMSLSESVDLVEHAFTHAETGDLFVRKAPASTIEQLARVLIDLFGLGEVKINEIGFRHGEKLFESLLSVEERVCAEELGDYFRVPMDSRDLNYDEYFHKGTSRDSSLEAYTSHNARRLTDNELIELLKSLPEISMELGR
jgi:UDP-glucose 4-epimerase